MAGDTNTVLVADGDPAVVARVRSWLAEAYRVEATTDGDEALALVEEADATVVGRDLRTASGTVVATEIERRAAPQTVAILREDANGNDPSVPNGDPLDKPVERATLLETVDRLLRRSRYDDLMDECTTLAAKRGAIETCDNLESGEDDETLQDRLDDVFSELDELVETFDGDDFRAAFARCEPGTATQPQCASEHP